MIRAPRSQGGTIRRLLDTLVSSKDDCASRDRRRLDRAVDLWLNALDAVTLAKETSDGN
jgi:hypothetical protein